MKKITSLLLIAVLLISAALGLTSCGGEEGMTFDEFVEEMALDDISFSDDGNGTYTGYESPEVSVAPTRFTVKCNDKNIVNSVEIECEDIDMSWMESTDMLLSSLKISTNDPDEKYRALSCLTYFDSLIDTVSGEYQSEDVAAEIIVNSSEKTFGDWKVSSVKGENTVTLKATLNK